MAGEQIFDNRELRDSRIAGVKEHVISGAELDEATLADLQENPEAYTESVRVLGYGVWSHVNGIPLEGGTEDIMDRYLSVIDGLIDRTPDDFSRKGLLVDMRAFVTT